MPLFFVAALLLSSASAQEKSEVTKLKPGHTYHSEIAIDAPPAAVWEVLTDFDNYPDWSVAFMELRGDFRDGGEVTVVYERKPGKGGKELVTDHVITVDDGVMFSWSDVFAAGIRDHHVFRVEPLDDGRTRFVQADEARGGMVWLVGGQVSTYHETYYPQFNRALKAEVERRQSLIAPAAPAESPPETATESSSEPSMDSSPEAPAE